MYSGQFSLFCIVSRVHLTFELSGAAELRPVKPACWRNVLERFVKFLEHDVSAQPVDLSRGFHELQLQPEYGPIQLDK